MRTRITRTLLYSTRLLVDCGLPRTYVLTYLHHVLCILWKYAVYSNIQYEHEHTSIRCVEKTHGYSVEKTRWKKEKSKKRRKGRLLKAWTRMCKYRANTLVVRAEERKMRTRSIVLEVYYWTSSWTTTSIRNGNHGGEHRSHLHGGADQGKPRNVGLLTGAKLWW